MVEYLDLAWEKKDNFLRTRPFVTQRLHEHSASIMQILTHLSYHEEFYKDLKEAGFFDFQNTDREHQARNLVVIPPWQAVLRYPWFSVDYDKTEQKDKGNVCRCF